MQLSVFEMVKKGVSTIIEVVDAFARTELVRLENLINNLSTVARTGSYNDLTDKPVIPTPQELSEVAYTGEYGDLLNKPTLFSGNYNDLTNKPIIPSETNDLTSSIIVNGAFNRVKIGNGYGITSGTLLNITYDLSNSYGSLYYESASINLPSNVTLSTVTGCSLQCIGDGGVYVSIRSFTNSRVEFYVMGPASGVHTLGLTLTMVGSV
mgnify:CR=1 FL=1